MMLFKTTWIAFFGALCFRISEIAGAPNTADCYSDKQFKEFIEMFQSRSVPVLITKGESNNEDKNILKLLGRFSNTYGYGTVIRVFVDHNNCPVTNGYFPSGERYPALFIVRNDHKYDEAFHWSPDAQIGSFLKRAADATLDNGTGVTDAIIQGIADRSNAALAGAAMNAEAGSDNDYWDQPPYPGTSNAEPGWSSTAGRSTGGSSRHYGY